MSIHYDDDVPVSSSLKTRSLGLNTLGVRDEMEWLLILAFDLYP